MESVESTTEERLDTFSSFRGYGKMSEFEEQEYRRKTRKRLIVISVSSVLLLAIVVAAAVAAVAHMRDVESESGAEQPAANPSSRISAVCSGTPHPDTCYSSLSAVEGPDNKTDSPEELLGLSLRVAADALSNVTSLLEALAKLTDDGTALGALDDCREMLRDAVGDLDESLELLRGTSSGGRELTRSEINSLRSWLGAAVADQAKCLDGLGNATVEIQDRMSEAMANSTRSTSNSLAIVAKVASTFHRKLLDTTAASSTSSSTGARTRIPAGQRRAMRRGSSSSSHIDGV